MPPPSSTGRSERSGSKSFSLNSPLSLLDRRLKRAPPLVGARERRLPNGSLQRQQAARDGWDGGRSAGCTRGRGSARRIRVWGRRSGGWGWRSFAATAAMSQFLRAGTGVDSEDLQHLPAGTGVGAQDLRQWLEPCIKSASSDRALRVCSRRPQPRRESPRSQPGRRTRSRTTRWSPRTTPAPVDRARRQ
jgi:hypothetical protein